MFIKIENGFPVGYPIVRDNLMMLIPHNVSIPPYPLTADLLPLGFAVYEFAPVPEVSDADFKVVEEATPQWTNDELRGDYITQVWSIRDMTQAERDSAIEKQWDRVRAERNSKLVQCDWTQLPDAPVDAAVWATYRQALRDVTTQSDPFAIVWPEQPE